MKASTIEETQASPKRKTRAKSAKAALSMCPVNGAGWCPYPFSPAQLAKRLKAIQDAENKKRSN